MDSKECLIKYNHIIILLNLQTTGDLTKKGSRAWIESHKYKQVYQGKNDNYL